MEAEGLPACADDHRHLLHRAVPRALADAVHRDLDLPGAVENAGEGVRDREAEVVVAVGGDDDGIGNRLDDASDEFPELRGRGVADGVGDVDRRRAGADRDAVALEEELDRKSHV